MGNKIIDIQVTIDAVGVMNNYTNPSQDPNAPTGIAHHYSYMVATSDTISGSGTGDLNFSATVGDDVRFFGTSASNNFDNSVLIYGIVSFNNTDVFQNGFRNENFTRDGVHPSGPSVIPAAISEESFWFFDSSVSNAGTEQFKVQFALYTRNDNGDIELYGYFQWDPTITVTG